MSKSGCHPTRKWEIFCKIMPVESKFWATHRHGRCGSVPCWGFSVQLCHALHTGSEEGGLY